MVCVYLASSALPAGLVHTWVVGCLPRASDGAGLGGARWQTSGTFWEPCMEQESPKLKAALLRRWCPFRSCDFWDIWGVKAKVDWKPLGLSPRPSPVIYFMAPTLHPWPNCHGVLCPKQKKIIGDYVSQQVLVPCPLCLVTRSPVFQSAVSTPEIKNNW